VNNPTHWETFNKYIDILIESQHKALEQTDNVVLMHRCQGAIHTLRRLKLIRDEANANQSK